MITLLIDGFGFDPQSRDITFTFDVNGQEVEWTLGMALASYGSSQDLKLEDMQQHLDNSTEQRWAQPEVMDSLIGVAYFLDMFGYHHGIS